MPTKNDYSAEQLLFVYDPLDGSYRSIGCLYDNDIYCMADELVDPQKVELSDMERLSGEEFVLQLKMPLIERIKFKLLLWRCVKSADPDIWYRALSRLEKAVNWVKGFWRKDE